ncbi:BamA/TamA family outer membrane protein [bacterium]|nr:BamA/TamA family outer membrane protein [bacterium]
MPQAIQQYHIEESPEKVFGAVEVKIRRIFDPPRNAIYRMANRLKISTREKMILQEVQFQEGEPYSNFLLSETARVLRTLRYLRDIRVIPIDRGDVVDVVIEVQDTWTIIPQMSFASGDGRTRKSVGISEGNFLGTGNRAELLYREDEGADTLQAVFDSRRLLGTKYQGVVGLANGAEGEEYLYDIGDPFRSLAQKTAWSHSALFGDTIERLFAAAEERFIYRKQTERVGGSYAFTLGSPEDALKRFQLGFQYLSESFREASASDFEDIGVDPETLRPEGGELAENRKFVGPTAGYQFIEQDFIRRNYIDRFVRVEDFNLGERFSSAVQWAPSLLESREDTLLWSTSYGDGYELEGLSFARWESRIESRLISEGFENTIFSLEGQYFNPLGEVEIGGRSLGYHTLVFRALLDYADNLDFDKELLVGGDNILRGYDARTFTGDKRYALNFEDRIHLAENVYDLISVGMAFFADVGGATRESLGELYTDNTFANVGVGLRLAFPKSNGERVVRIDLALPLRAGPDGSDSFELRVIFSGGQLFGSRLGTERASSQQVGVDLGF